MNEKERNAYNEALRRIDECRREEKGGTSLNLRALRLTTLPPEIGQLTALKVLHLNGSHLMMLPPETGQLTALTHLNIAGNQFTMLPPEISELTALRVLYLHGNQLSTLPPEIGQLKDLRELWLTGNQLTKLPAEIGQLRALTRLLLAGNVLTTLPSEIGHFTALTELDLTGNRLTELPAEIGQLRALTRLLLAGNVLTTLPPEIGHLPALTELDLTGNQLIKLPVKTGQLTALKGLFLHENPGLGMPAEVLGPTSRDVTNNKTTPASPRAILDYYSRLQRGTYFLNEFKLILVGHGAVGKTALVNRVARGEFIPTDLTRGIHIESWEVQAGNDRVAAHVWDFGGQDIMHGTHQFFLTHRSLYLLVLAARESKQDEDAEYWLKTISAFGGDSPVIVVLNKSDERPCNVNENALRKKYRTIREFIKTDCQTGKGIEELKAAISRAADKLEGLRDLFPASWFAIKMRLSGMRENFLTFDKFRQECAKLGEPRGKGQEALASVLHILGVALNFRDDDRLRDTSVLNPLWVTRGLYTLLNDNELARRHGELEMEDFADILSAKDYPVETHEFLRELMSKFELCFPLDQSANRYLIPELLSQQEPDAAGPLDTNEALALTYFYPRMLPHGLVPRFIVRLYQIIKDRLRWRTGAVLEWFDATALVKADADDRCVRIRVHGSRRRRRELLGIIRQEFDELHRQFRGLLPREVIQLPDYPDVSVDYSHVEAAARAGMTEMPVFTDGNMIKVSPDALLTEFEVEGEERDAGNRGASEVEPTPPPHRRQRASKEEEGGP